MTSQRHLCHHISIYDVCAFVLSLNVYFKEGEFHADREMMRVVTPLVPPLHQRVGARGGGGVDEVTHRCEWDNVTK